MDMKQKSRRNQNGQELISTKVSEFSHNTAGSEAAKFSAFKKLVSLELRPFAHVCQNSLTPSPPSSSVQVSHSWSFFFPFGINQSARSLSGSVRSDLILLLRSSPVAKVRSFTVAGK